MSTSDCIIVDRLMTNSRRGSLGTAACLLHPRRLWTASTRPGAGTSLAVLGRDGVGVDRWTQRERSILGASAGRPRRHHHQCLLALRYRRSMSVSAEICSRITHLSNRYNGEHALRRIMMTVFVQLNSALVVRF